MNLYVSIVAGGSIFTFFYIVFNSILPCEFTLTEKSLLLKCNILFHILPIPWIVFQGKRILKPIFEKYCAVFPQIRDFYGMHYNNMWKSSIIKNENNQLVYITGYQKVFPFIVAIAVIFAFLILGWIFAYLITCSNCKKNAVFIDNTEYIEEVKARKRIKICMSPDISWPVAVGIVKPVILLPTDNVQYVDSCNGIIRHEMGHILRGDMLFRFLSFVIIALEWYNPLAYYLFKENRAVSELLCDERAVMNMSKREKVKYLNCIIAATEKSKSTKVTIMTLGTKKKITKERVLRIMEKDQKRNWKKRTALGITIICFAISSMPTLAYDAPTIVKDVDFGNAVESWEQMDMVIISPREEGDAHYFSTLDYSINDSLLISASGEIYPYEVQGEEHLTEQQLSCVHNFENVTYTKHMVIGEGCKIVNYNAQMCSKCGYIIMGEEVSAVTYKVCPHK